MSGSVIQNWRQSESVSISKERIPINSIFWFRWKVARDCLTKSDETQNLSVSTGRSHNPYPTEPWKKTLVTFHHSGCLKLDSHCWAFQIPICPLQNPKNPQGFFAALSWAGDWSQANILHLSETVHRFIFRDWLIIANKTGPQSVINGVITSVRPVKGYKVGPYQLYQL